MTSDTSTNTIARYSQPTEFTSGSSFSMFLLFQPTNTSPSSTVVAPQPTRKSAMTHSAHWPQTPYLNVALQKPV